MTPVVLLGALGSACFALSGIPEAWQAITTGHSAVASGTVALWLGGEAAMLGYVRATHPRDWLLTLNYTANLLVVGVIAFYRWGPG